MLKIVFMGTPDFAVASLRVLVESRQYQILAVVSQPDRPKGRGRKIVPTPVKAYAASVGLPVLQPEKVKTPEFAAQLRRLAPDFLVVAAFGQILSRELLDIPRCSCVNVHASLLPQYRGAAPLNYALMKGETVSGVTIMHMEAGMDTGGIYAQVEVPISPEMTAGELEAQCSQKGAELLLASLPGIADGSLKYVPQNEAEATKATLLSRAMESIDWKKPAQQIHDLIRAFDPAPGAYTFAPNGKILKIWSSRVTEGVEGVPAGTVLAAGKKSFSVACGQGALIILEVQPESKKRMSSQVFLNGHGLQKGDILGEP